ncbi:MAG: LacI family transcriptional regulator [Actinomycetota bacterium]|nr:LacI family transcriptional regulator [Actinomycetota bacterium]
MSTHAQGASTLQDVAYKAGVSLATASRVLNGSTRRVGDDPRRRVLAAAARLNYSANAQAQAMARGRTNVIGLLVHDLADPYFSTIAASVIAAADKHRLLVTIASTDRRPERELEYVATLRGQRARAVILAGSRMEGAVEIDRLGAELTTFEAAGGRVALISQRGLPVNTVLVENRAGARHLATELVALGYRRFAVLAGPLPLLTAKDRASGFREGLARAGIALSPADVVAGDFTRDGGYAGMTALLDVGLHSACVFAVNDVMAVGAMAALRDRGLQMPRDMAVAGFDDIVTLRDVTPALTTVRLPLGKIGEMALELVTSAQAERPHLRRIRGEVVLRASTPPLR